MNAPTNPYGVLIGLCTILRQQGSLCRAIESVLELVVPKGVTVELAVVDNTKTAAAKQLVTGFINTSPLNIHYCHEPVPNMALAGNHVLELALELDVTAAIKPQVIAFFDDDAALDKNWLRHFHSCYCHHKENTDAPLVLTGPQQEILPDESPIWVKKTDYFFQPWTFPTNTPRPTAAGHNVFFDIDLVKPGSALRFDPNLGITGGLDTLFYMQTIQKGALIFWVEEAVVREYVREERINFKWVIKRYFRCSSTRPYIDRKLWGWPKSLALAIGRGGVYLGLGLVLLLPLGSLACLLPSLRHHTLKSLIYISYGLGSFAGIFGIRYREYA